MLTDPALDAGRHEFELRTLLGRVLPPEENLQHIREHRRIRRCANPAHHRRHVLRSALPEHGGGGFRWAAYLNEEPGMPVRMSTGEGGCPPRRCGAS